MNSNRRAYRLAFLATGCFGMVMIFFASAQTVQAAECLEKDFICAPWTICANSAPTRHRVCFKAYNLACRGGYIPAVVESCEKEVLRPCTEKDWTCTAPWGACGAGMQYRTCALNTAQCNGGYVATTSQKCEVAARPQPTIPAPASNSTPIFISPSSETPNLPACTSSTIKWRCTPSWTQCDQTGMQYRTCDYNRDQCIALDEDIKKQQQQTCVPPTPILAPGATPRPPVPRTCTTDVWDCSAWSVCRTDGNRKGVETRTCVLQDDCDKDDLMPPAMIRACARPNRVFQPSCTIKSFVRPSHSSSVKISELCSWQYNGQNKEIRLGQALLPIVWGSPFRFTVQDKQGAMGTAYASVMFNYDPNYLNAIATKESRANCLQINHDGCHQIETPSFNSLAERFYGHLGGAKHDDYVQRWDLSAVTAAFHYRMSESLFRLWYRWDDLGKMARDPEAQTKLLTRSYNRGQWDNNIQAMMTKDWDRCTNESDIISCYDNNDVAYDHTKAVLSYCRAYRVSSNVYDAVLTWNDIDAFIDQTVKGTNRNYPVDWVKVKQIAKDTFNCLRDANGVISFRYDFATVLLAIQKNIPPIEQPRNIVRDYGRSR